MSNLSTRKNTFILPGIVSAFLPGVGQLLKKHIKKGILFLVLWGGFSIVFAILNFLLGWVPLFSWLIGAIGGIAWLINVLDAFFSKKDVSSLNLPQ